MSIKITNNYVSAGGQPLDKKLDQKQATHATENPLEEMEAPRINQEIISRETWRAILETARRSPSPHNVQPWIVKYREDGKVDLFIDGTRTFPFTDSTGSFIISSMSMFTAMIHMAGQNAGFQLGIQISSLDKLNLQDPESHFATLELIPTPGCSPAPFSNESLQKRKTSRKPNLHKAVSPQLIIELKKLAEGHGYSLVTAPNQKVVTQALRCDAKALFQDFNHKEYFGELRPFLKLEPKKENRDGLHYSVMNLSRVEFGFLKYLPGAFQIPVLNKILEARYMNQLGHCEELCFISGKFWERTDAAMSGVMLINLWLTLNEHNLYLHPFGNLVTNREARSEVEKLLGIQDLWFVFRLGYTDEPNVSSRLSVDSFFR